MSLYEDQVLPRVIDVVLGSAALGPMRKRTLDGISGSVLEIGFGSGTNLDHYPAEVTHLYAVDPADVGRKLARKRIARAPFEVEFVGLDGQSIPLDDDSVDNAVSTWTLCTVPDAAAALAEIRRIVRPGGCLYFLEHGLSDDPRVARRQERADRFQQRIAGGCHLNRRHDLLVSDAGFDIVDLTTFDIAGPKTLGHMYAGRAAVPA